MRLIKFSSRGGPALGWKNNLPAQAENFDKAAVMLEPGIIDNGKIKDRINYYRRSGSCAIRLIPKKNSGYCDYSFGKCLHKIIQYSHSGPEKFGGSGIIEFKKHFAD